MRINLLSRLPLMLHDSLQQAVEMLVLAVIVLVELLKPVGQVRPQNQWGIVPLQ